MILTYRYRLKGGRAARTLRRHAWAVNQVWNWLTAYQKNIEARYRLGAKPRKWPSHYDLTSACSGVGADLGIHQQTVQSVCRQFITSRKARKGAPRFRASSGSKRALGWVPFQQQSRRIDGNSVTYRGETFRWFGSKRRPLPETAGSGAFVEDALGHWWACFRVEVETRPHIPGAHVGIDLGLKTLAALSDGRRIEAPRIYRKYEQRLGVAQRARNKQRTRRLHAKIANCRRDFLHKASTELARNHSLIAVGNVSSSKLAKTRMAKSVLDAGWSAFRFMLSYKCQQAGASFLEVDEKWTSVTCSECGALSGPKGQKGLRIREWACDCGASHDRDTNAARNILARSASRPAEGSQ